MELVIELSSWLAALRICSLAQANNEGVYFRKEKNRQLCNAKYYEFEIKSSLDIFADISRDSAHI